MAIIAFSQTSADELVGTEWYNSSSANPVVVITGIKMVNDTPWVTYTHRSETTQYGKDWFSFQCRYSLEPSPWVRNTL